MIHKLCFYFLNEYEKKKFFQLDKNIHIIYRNYSKKYNINHILELKRICKLQKRKFFLANNLKLALRLNLDGAYIPSFDKSILPLKFKKDGFLVLGSAHNLKEINIKKRQGVNLLFISPIFKILKKNYFLGTIKYNILANKFGKKTIALGGINQTNIRVIKNINCYGFASISYIEKYKFNGKKYF